MPLSESEKMQTKIAMWKLLSEELGADGMNAHFMLGFIQGIVEERRKDGGNRVYPQNTKKVEH